MNFWVRQAAKTVVCTRSFSLFFIINLAMGLTGFMGIHSFSTSLDRYLTTNLNQILTADLALSAARPLNSGELDLVDRVLGQDKHTARQISFYTMVLGKTGARLTQVIAVDENYPLYGSMNFETLPNTARLQEYPEIVMTRDTARTFGIVPGDTLALGNTLFVFKDMVRTDPDRSLTSFDLAPKLYMGIHQLESTGLLGFGSRVRYRYFYRFPETEDIAALKAELNTRFEERFQGHPMIQVSDRQDLSRGLGRITTLFTGYLGLVSSVALFLAGIATAYLFRGYLDQQKTQVAILMGIGAKQREIFALYMMQLLILGSVASLVAVALSVALLPVFPILLKGLLPDNLTISVQPFTVVMALGMGMAGSLVFCLPVFYRLLVATPLSLLQENRPVGSKTAGQLLVRLLLFVPGIIGFMGLAAALTNSLKKGMVFTLGLMGVMVCLSVMGMVLFKACRLLSLSENPVRKIAFRNLYKNFIPSLACFVTIAMGGFLISLIPQLQRGLENELIRPDGLKIPTFFLVDIQEEQRPDLQEFINRQNAALTNMSPMVRGRILAINGDNFFERQKQAARNNPGRQFRRLEFNFSFRQDLDTSESIIAGRPLSRQPWQFSSTSPFEISLAEEFSQWYSIHLNDVIDIDIQGVSFKGRVVNIRKVRWNSFQPNFFLLFQDGVLNDAPKTYLASIARVQPDHRVRLRNDIAKTFPNISVVDVTQTVATLLEIMDRLSLSIKFMALLAIAAGLVSIFSIARHESRNSQRQVLLLKVLGCEFKDIRAISITEFGFTGFFAAAAGVGLSLAASWALSWFFFDRLWDIRPMATLFILAMTPLACMATSWVAVGKTLAAKPALLLSKDP